MKIQNILGQDTPGSLYLASWLTRKDPPRVRPTISKACCFRQPPLRGPDGRPCIGRRRRPKQPTRTEEIRRSETTGPGITKIHCFGMPAWRLRLHGDGPRRWGTARTKHVMVSSLGLRIRPAEGAPICGRVGANVVAQMGRPLDLPVGVRGELGGRLEMGDTVRSADDGLFPLLELGPGDPGKADRPVWA